MPAKSGHFFFFSVLVLVERNLVAAGMASADCTPAARCKAADCTFVARCTSAARCKVVDCTSVARRMVAGMVFAAHCRTIAVHMMGPASRRWDRCRIDLMHVRMLYNS